MSIRKFLLIYLLLALTVTTTLTAIGNYYLDQKDIQEHLDSLMAMSAISYQALIGSDIRERDLERIQTELNNLQQEIENRYAKHFNYARHNTVSDNFNFQVWNDAGKLLLHSPNAPLIPLTGSLDGFSDKIVEGKPWRVFTVYNPSNGITTVVAERYDSRKELGHRIAQDDLYIMLLTFPLAALLIWLTIGRGLRSITRTAKEVANRAPTHLEAVAIERVPVEIKPLIAELNKLFRRLQEAFEREKRFAADAAHELRTPLAALKTQAQVALLAENEDERRTALNNLIAGVDRATHVVQQLLTLSRLTPSEMLSEDDLAPVSLPKLAAEIIAGLAPEALRKKIEIALEYDKEEIFVYGNVISLGILIRNLVDNAIRYTPNGGDVKISIETTDYHTILNVEDSGPGIPAELRDRVFERFFRVLGTKSPGSGLGLAIVQQIANLHRADVELKTATSGQGLLIQILFPNYEAR